MFVKETQQKLLYYSAIFISTIPLKYFSLKTKAIYIQIVTTASKKFIIFINLIS